MPESSSRIRWKNQTPEPPANSGRSVTPSSQPAPPPNNLTPLIDQIGRDLTQLARQGRLKPLFGRQAELLQLQRILLRMEKNNPLLVGAPGVGKTALVEGLAMLIVSGRAASDLLSLRIVEITPASLTAGTNLRGSFESKLQDLILQASRDPDLILFVDEIHTLVGAGAVGGGTLDAANILKPALARGEIHVIGATTSDEFDQFLHSDSAFERRFEPLILEEPTESEAVEILKAALPEYIEHHHLEILPEAAEAAVRLSMKHILDRRLPDKAFDLLDSACTWVRLPGLNADTQQNPGIVDGQVVSRALAEKLNIPTEKLSQDLRERLSGLEDALQSQVLGQRLAMSSIAAALRTAYSGLGKPNQPRCVFAFFGSSGIGKTAAAKALAKFLFDTPDALIRLDMSEYKEPHSVSRLLGSPPGYIGYDDEGTFATRLRRQSFSIVLLDEVEKAHPQVHDVFLQIFDEGRFTDTHGRVVEARNAIFILTSNLFTLSEINSTEEYEQHAASIRQSLTGSFRPEFVNRINEVVLFSELRPTDLAKIAILEIAGLNERLAHYKIQVEASQEALDWIAKSAYDPNSGARAVIRLVTQEIAGPVSDRIVRGEIQEGQKLRVVVEENRLILND